MLNSITKEQLHTVFVRSAMVLYDAVAVNAAYFLAIVLRFYVRFEFQAGAEEYIPIFWSAVPVFTLVSILVFYAFHMYNTMWEYAGGHDVMNVFKASMLTGVAYVALTLTVFGRMPISTYLLGPVIQLGLIMVSRFGYRLYLLERNDHIIKQAEVKRTMIIGVDSLGRFARAQINSSTNRTVVCMVDVDPASSIRYLNGLPVAGGMDKLEQTLQQYRVQHVVIADVHLPEEDIHRIKSLCEAQGVSVENLIEYLQGYNDTAQSPSIAIDNGARVIPFSPPDISEREINEVVQALKSGWITTGPRTKELEKRLSVFCHTSRTVCLNSATAAEELNFRVCGIGEEDEVVVA